MGLDLAGKTLGLVGVGRIGHSVARMAGPGFRMRVLGFDPHADAARLARAGIEAPHDLAGAARRIATSSPCTAC